MIGQAGLGVLKKGKNARVAADFLAFFTNPANSAKLAQFFPPPRKSLLNAETLAKTNPLLKPEQLQTRSWSTASRPAWSSPATAGTPRSQQAVRAALDPLWKPDANVKSVAATVACCAQITPRCWLTA